MLSLRTREYVGEVSRDSALHDADVHAVGVLVSAEHEGTTVTASRLARELDLSRAAVTALVGRMERAGHVVREGSAVDRRTVSLRATASAHAMSEARFAPMIEAYQEALAGYDDDELALVADAIERLADATRTGGAQQPPGDDPSTTRPPTA